MIYQYLAYVFKYGRMKDVCITCRIITGFCSGPFTSLLLVGVEQRERNFAAINSCQHLGSQTRAGLPIEPVAASQYFVQTSGVTSILLGCIEPSIRDESHASYYQLARADK